MGRIGQLRVGGQTALFWYKSRGILLSPPVLVAVGKQPLISGGSGAYCGLEDKETDPEVEAAGSRIKVG